MNILTALMQSGEGVKRRLRGLLEDPLAELELSADENVEAYTNPIAKALGAKKAPNPLTWDNQSADDMAGNYLGAGVMPMGMLGHTVWHGSPHKFSKFDMSKIGTGEGAQAYGHGFYVAEAKDVGKEYADKLGRNIEVFGKPLYVDGKYQRTGLGTIEDSLILGAKGNIDDAIKQALIDYPTNHSGIVKNLEKARGGVKAVDNGNLYKVDIPDEAIPRMLDWDKPLSEQAPEVLGAVRSALKAQKRSDADITWLMGKPASQVENFLMPSGNKAEASTNLLKAGIPGIRYLDGGSRGAGAGTSNFVLFDDNMARILENNGVATGLEAWKPGEYVFPKGRK